jgi:hypothetical protein
MHCILPDRRFIARCRTILAVTATLWGMALPAHAGQNCSDQPLSATTLHHGMQLAQQVQARLDQTRANVAIIGRVGMDLSEYKVTYTHAGIAFRVASGQPWRIAHLLNACGSATSDLWFQGLGNFFLDDLFAFDAVLMVPPPGAAQRLLQAATSTAALRSVHNSAYSMVAYPFALKYQNSNDWVLETVAAALSKDAFITTREQAQSWLKLADYQPAEMHIPPLKRLGARMFKANVAFNDHPNALRFNDRIQTVTVDSMMAFFDQRKKGWQMLTVKGSNK